MLNSECQAGTDAWISTKVYCTSVRPNCTKPTVSCRFWSRHKPKKMQQLITAIERQIKLEEGKEMSRQMMLSNSSDVLFDKPLTKSNPEYLKELKEVLPLLKYLSNPIEDWNNLVDGVINVPDELDPLLNKLGMQLRFHTISGKGEVETVCSMVAIAQKFFHQFKPLVKGLGTVANGS